MFMIRLQDIAPLINGTAPFTLISNQAEFKITLMALSIIVRNPSPRFMAVILLPRRLFSTFHVSGKHISRISLDSLHEALLEGQNFSSMTLHLLESENRLILRFENSRHMSRLHHELTLSPPEELDVGQPTDSRYFSVAIQEFRHIITELSPYTDETIFVTLTGRQVHFSVASEEIILTEERGECLVIGDGDAEVQLKITLHPTSFFLNLANQATRVWFFKIDENRCVINFPYHAHARYLVYFSIM